MTGGEGVDEAGDGIDHRPLDLPSALLQELLLLDDLRRAPAEAKVGEAHRALVLGPCARRRGAQDEHHDCRRDPPHAELPSRCPPPSAAAGTFVTWWTVRGAGTRAWARGCCACRTRISSNRRSS